MNGVKIMQHQDENMNDIVSTCLRALRNKGVRLPRAVFWRKMWSWGRCRHIRKPYYSHKRFHYNIVLNNRIPYDQLWFVIVHEVIHGNGYGNHSKRFWRKFFNACLKLNLDITKDQIHYASGQRYLHKFLTRRMSDE